MLVWPALGQGGYPLQVRSVDRDSSFLHRELGIPQNFLSREDCRIYLDQLLPDLQARGYITASLDSVEADSSGARVLLFLGRQYRWMAIKADSTSLPWLRTIGWDPTTFNHRPFDRHQLQTYQRQLLDAMENNGYPFASVSMQDMQLNGEEVSGTLHVETGPRYHIDSLKITGNARISKEYLQQYLDIRNGSVYNKQKLQGISTALKKLNYVEETFPPQFHWRSTGGVVELFLDGRKSSQINVVVGFLPGDDPQRPKLRLTGEALLQLNNTLGAGETLGLVWQALQVSSQQLSINYKQPYLFRSPFGIDFGFNMFKKDSSFLNFNFDIGVQYQLTAQQELKVYLQRFSTILSGIDAAAIIRTRQLPGEADLRMTSLGFQYRFNNTDYIYNPVAGTELFFNTMVGLKKIRPNNQILELQDPSDPGFDFARLYDTVKSRAYQWRSELAAARYFPLGKSRRSTLRLAVNGGYISGSRIYRNELFQIGGNHLLRGFDEQSQYLSAFGIGSLEYRYLVGPRSYFNVFSDGGWGRESGSGTQTGYTYISGGFGLAFETKAGQFRLAWAIGKRNDTDFNLRQSKIHFGFLNYF
ncbi:hypothetical protein GCM10027051_22500 [Niabella terrae]